MKIPLSKLNHEALLNGVVSLAAKVMAEPPVEQAMRVVAGHYRDIQTFRYWQNVLSLVDPDTKVDPDTLPHMLPIGTSSTLGFPLFLLTKVDLYPSIRAPSSEIVLSFLTLIGMAFYLVAPAQNLAQSISLVSFLTSLITLLISLICPQRFC